MRPTIRLLLVLLMIAFAIRLAAGWAWQSRIEGPFGMGDSEGYWSLAQCIAEGKPYAYGPDQFQAFRTPGYPILLTPVVWLAGDGRNGVLLARAEAALFGTLAVAAVWWLTRLLFNERAALLAAAFAAFSPGAIVLSALVLSEAPFCPLMLLQLGLWALAWEAPTRTRTAGWGFCGGLVAGLATLMRPSWLLFTPLAAGVLLLPRLGKATNAPKSQGTVPIFVAGRDKNGTVPLGPAGEAGRGSWARRAVLAVCMMLGLVAAMLPWWIRNARVFGRFVPTSLQVGASLYDGLNPEATGGSDMDFVPRFLADERNAAGQSPGESLEVRLDRRLRDASVAWTRENPAKAFELAGVKFARMWNVWPNEPRFSAWPVRLAVFFTYTPMLVLGIMGAWRTVRRGWPYVLCWLPAVYLTALHVVFVSSLRYREPAMLAMLALAAGGALAVAMKDGGDEGLAI